MKPGSDYTPDADDRQCVLFVDDEPNVLKALQRLCYRETYAVVTANSGALALKILAECAVDLVVSDLRMPDMDGIALLTEVAWLYPDIPRILLSGNADMGAMVSAMNKRQLSYFLPKPWNEQHLRETLREFLQRRYMEKAYQSLLATVSRQNAELSQLNDKSIAEAALKSKFLSVMSHELRTPVNGIHGIFDLLRGESVGEAAQLVDLGLSTSRHLISIVDDILDYSKLESNAMVLEHIAFLPLREVQAAFNLAQVGANYSSVKFDLQVRIDATLKLLGDPVRIRQILMNMLGNAVKFTKQGTISLTVRYEQSHLSLRVEDTGIGIPAALQHLLYGEFTTLDASHARKFGGTGLGLSIVHRLVTQMQGNITLLSAEGEGACFTVRLPLEETTAEIIDDSQIVLSLSGLSIALVDDNETNRLVASSMLEAAGASVSTFNGGRQFLVAVGAGLIDPAVVLMDISMPDIDGIETTRQLRELSLVSADVPIVAMTAFVQADEKAAFRAAGLDYHLAKPLTRTGIFQLFESVGPILKGRDQPSAVEYSHADFAKLAKDLSPGVLEKLIRAFSRDCKKIQATLEVAMAEQNWRAYAREIHSLGSNAAMLGASSLADLCRKSEVAFNEQDLSFLVETSPRLVAMITPGLRQIETWLAATQA